MYDNRDNPKPSTLQTDRNAGAPRPDKRPTARATSNVPTPETPRHTYCAYGIRPTPNGYVVTKVYMNNEGSLRWEDITQPDPSPTIVLGYLETKIAEDYFSGR